MGYKPIKMNNRLYLINKKIVNSSNHKMIMII